MQALWSLATASPSAPSRATSPRAGLPKRRRHGWKGRFRKYINSRVLAYWLAASPTISITSLPLSLATRTGDPAAATGNPPVPQASVSHAGSQSFYIDPDQILPTIDHK